MTPMIDPSFHYSQTDHEHYLRAGYCFFECFLSAAGLAFGRRQIDRMVAQLQPGRSPEHMISCHQQEQWLFELACEPQILDLVERQIGPDIVLWSSHLLIKPPRTGKAVPWHQDVPYWNIKGELPGGLWIPFDDVASANGTMSILPGLHREELPRRARAGELFSEEIDSAYLTEDLESRQVEYRLKAGQLALHHTLIPHSSTPNSTDQWRRVLVLRYMDAAGTAGPKEYEDYRTGAKFERELFLLRGRDLANRALRSSPF